MPIFGLKTLFFRALKEHVKAAPAQESLGPDIHPLTSTQESLRPDIHPLTSTLTRRPTPPRCLDLTHREHVWVRAYGVFRERIGLDEDDAWVRI